MFRTLRVFAPLLITLAATMAMAADPELGALTVADGTAQVSADGDDATVDLSGSTLILDAVDLRLASLEGVLVEGIPVGLDASRVVLGRSLPTSARRRPRQRGPIQIREDGAAEAITLDGQIVLDPIQVTLREEVVSHRPYVSRVVADVLFDLEVLDAEGDALAGDAEITLKTGVMEVGSDFGIPAQLLLGAPMAVAA